MLRGFYQVVAACLPATVDSVQRPLLDALRLNASVRGDEEGG